MKRASDGATYYEVYVKDLKGDGVCAHGSGAWMHDNDTHYYDYGMWVCGAGQGKWFTKPARNWTKYQGTFASAFVDGGWPSLNIGPYVSF